MNSADIREKYDRLFQLGMHAEREKMLLGVIGDIILYLEELERKTAELDTRTVSMIRLGPRPQAISTEELNETVYRIVEALPPPGSDETIRCTEYNDKLPTSSDHLWNADHHGIPCGNCLKCGEPIESYNHRMMKVWAELQGRAGA